MSGKRPPEEERTHLLKKIRRLERKINNLPDSDREDNVDINEEQVEKENKTPSSTVEDFLFESLIEENQEDILDVLGVAPGPAPKKEVLHKEVADRRSEILNKGLKYEEKEPLTQENICFDNVPKMVPPKLNKEVAAAMNESARKKDQIIENRQKQISTALSCIGQALQMSLQDIQENIFSIIKKIHDAGRLLSDSLFLDSKRGRTLVLSSINKDLKDFLLETEMGEYLFGENLVERIKTAKAVQKSGKDLKVDDKKKYFAKQNEANDKKMSNNRALNCQGPPRAGAQRYQKPGGLAFNKQQQSSVKKEIIPSRRGRK